MNKTSNKYIAIITSLLFIMIAILLDKFGFSDVSAAETAAEAPRTCTPTSYYSYSHTTYSGVSVDYSKNDVEYDDPALGRFTPSQTYTDYGYNYGTNSDCTTYDASYPSAYRFGNTSPTGGTSVIEDGPFKKVYKYNATGSGGKTASKTVTIYIAKDIDFTYTKNIHFDAGTSGFGLSCERVFSDTTRKGCEGFVTYELSVITDDITKRAYTVNATHNVSGSAARIEQTEMTMWKAKSVNIVPYGEEYNSDGVPVIYMDSARFGVERTENFSCTVFYYGNGLVPNYNCKSSMTTVNTNTTPSKKMLVEATNKEMTNGYFIGVYSINANVNGLFVPESGKGLRIASYSYKHNSGGNDLADTKKQLILYPTEVKIEGDTKGYYHQKHKYSSYLENRQSGEGEKVTCKKIYGNSETNYTADCIFASPVITNVIGTQSNSRTYHSNYLTANNNYIGKNQATYTHHWGSEEGNFSVWNNSAPKAALYSDFKEKDAIRRNYYVYKENGVSDSHFLDYYYVISIDVKPTDLSTEDVFIAVNETHDIGQPYDLSAIVENGGVMKEQTLAKLATHQYEVTDYFDKPTCEYAFSDGKKGDCTYLLEDFFNYPSAYANRTDAHNPNDIADFKSTVYTPGDTVRYERFAFGDNGYFDKVTLKFAYANKVSGNMSKPLTYSDSDWGEYRCTVTYQYPLQDHPKNAEKHKERIINNKQRDCWYRLYYLYSDDVYENGVRSLTYRYQNNTHNLEMTQTRIYAEKVQIMNYALPEAPLTHDSSTGKTGSRYEYICYVFWADVPTKLTEAGVRGEGLDDKSEFAKKYNEQIRTKASDISLLEDVWSSNPRTGENKVSYIGDEWLATGHTDREGIVTFPDKINELYIVDNKAKVHDVSCTYQNDDKTSLATKLEKRAAQISDYEYESSILINNKLKDQNLNMSDVEILTDTKQAVNGNETNFQAPVKYNNGQTRTDNKTLSIRNNDLREHVNFNGQAVYYEEVQPVKTSVSYNLIGMVHMYMIDVTYSNTISRDTYENSYNPIDTFKEDNQVNPFKKAATYTTAVVIPTTAYDNNNSYTANKTVETTTSTNNQDSFYIATDTAEFDFEKYTVNGSEVSTNLGMYEDMAMLNMNYQTNHWYDYQICILWSNNLKSAFNGQLGYYDGSTYYCYKGGEEDILNSTWSYGSNYGEENNASKIILDSNENGYYKDGSKYESYTDGLAYDLESLQFSISNTNIPFNAMDHRTPNEGWNSIRFDLYSEYNLEAPHNENTEANRNYVVTNYWSRSPEGILIVQSSDNAPTATRITNDMLLNIRNNSNLESLFNELSNEIVNIRSKYGATQHHQAWLLWNDSSYVKHDGTTKMKNIITKNGIVTSQQGLVNPWRNSTWKNINTIQNSVWNVKETNTPLNVQEELGLGLTYNEFEAFESYRTISVSWGDNYRISESNSINPYWDFVHQAIVVNLGDFNITPDGLVNNPADPTEEGCNVEVPRQGCIVEPGGHWSIPTSERLNNSRTRTNEIEIKIDVTGVSKGTGN